MLQKVKFDHNCSIVLRTLKGNINVVSISLVQQSTVNLCFSKLFINSKIYRCLHFFWVNCLGWHKTLFVIFQMTLMAESMVIGIHSLESLACQIWNEAFKGARLRDFKMSCVNLTEHPNRRRQDFRDVRQHPLAPTSTANK